MCIRLKSARALPSSGASRSPMKKVTSAMKISESRVKPNPCYGLSKEPEGFGKTDGFSKTIPSADGRNRKSEEAMLDCLPVSGKVITAHPAAAFINRTKTLFFVQQIKNN